MGFPTGDSWSFKLGGHEKVTPPTTDAVVAALMDDPKRWEQYTDELLYQVERDFLAWANNMLENGGTWKKVYSKRRYTTSMLYERMYGRRPDYSKGSDDHKLVDRLAKVVNYYCSRRIKETEINGKKAKNVYVISPHKVRKYHPYSLRLRLEWMSERGIIPDKKKLRIHKLNPIPYYYHTKTRRNAELRAQRARDVYNERYNRNHSS